ncbi:MAG: FtsX-like permease family protein [Eubacteriales bacterium]|nr:FtsX-like permease family protein [Eubacteriales bacterium]
MDILKKIAKDRLVIMVTHNPDLAETYSTRIIKILDGMITCDTSPLTDEEIRAERINSILNNHETAKLPSMSIRTSFSLSLKNLLTKKSRTILTSFAGSIGIIGIALIIAISQGLSGYINSIQEETLSSYPLTIQRSEADMSSIMQTFMGMKSDTVNHEKDAVYTKPAIYNMMNAMNTLEEKENDLESFKEYIEFKITDKDSPLYHAVNSIQYGYDLDLQVYTETVDDVILKSDTQELFSDLLMEYADVDIDSMMGMLDDSSLGIDSSSMLSAGTGMNMNLWQEMLPGKDGETVSDLLKNQYDLVYGEWPEEYDEIVLVLDNNNELDDMTLYALGLESKEEAAEIIKASLNKEEIQTNDSKWSYEEICNMSFRTVLNSDCYSYDESTGLYSDLRDSAAGMRYLYDNGIPLKVTGIIRPNENTSSTILSGTIGYTSKLTEYVIEHAKDSEVIKSQLADQTKDVITGLPFKSTTGSLTDSEKESKFKEYISQMDEAQKAEMYIKIKGVPAQEQVTANVEQIMSNLTREEIENNMLQALTEEMKMNESDVRDYLASMSDEEIKELFAEMTEEQIKAEFAAQAEAELSYADPATLAYTLESELPSYTTEQYAQYYDELIVFSENTYDENLTAMGYLDLNSPSSINIYSSSFENKDLIEDAIAEYNKGVDEIYKIKYTDYVGIMMSSISTIINAITYVLIAFVAISLIVSSIMIAVITLISVQERTKEIGILRAIGASKKNVSNMFNAETVIIGFSSGILGVIITYLLCIPINNIIHDLSGISDLNAYLPLNAAAVLILISILLTLISGIIPAKSAASKDPVVALRSE